MKVEYDFTKEQKFSLSLLMNCRESIQNELQKAYLEIRTDNDWQYIKSLNNQLTLIVAQIAEIYMVTPTRCLLTKEDFENLKKGTQYDDELINVQNQMGEFG